MTVLETLGAGAGALLVLGALLRGVWRFNRRIVRITDLVVELSPNHGHSVKDVVERNEQTAARTEAKVDDLAARFDQHLTDHARRPRRWARR